MKRSIEWPTLILTLCVYGAYAFGAIVVLPVSLVLGLLIMVTAGVLHSSLTHEVLHGHPFNSAFLNALLVFPALIIFVPYLRFKDTHLDHHRDERLTDPYDDPETNFMDPQVWDQLPKWRQSLHLLNNTLLGRMFWGQCCHRLPSCAQISFDLGGGSSGCIGMAVTCALVDRGLCHGGDDRRSPIWLWILAAYLSMAILKIRTYLEHRVMITRVVAVLWSRIVVYCPSSF